MAEISGGEYCCPPASTRASPLGPATTLYGTIASSSRTSGSLRPMKRLMEKIVFCGLVTAWRLATVPTRRFNALPCACGHKRRDQAAVARRGAEAATARGLAPVRVLRLARVRRRSYPRRLRRPGTPRGERLRRGGLRAVRHERSVSPREL